MNKEQTLLILKALREMKQECENKNPKTKEGKAFAEGLTQAYSHSIQLIHMAQLLSEPNNNEAREKSRKK